MRSSVEHAQVLEWSTEVLEWPTGFVADVWRICDSRGRGFGRRPASRASGLGSRVLNDEMSPTWV